MAGDRARTAVLRSRSGRRGSVRVDGCTGANQGFVVLAISLVSWGGLVAIARRAAWSRRGAPAARDTLADTVRKVGAVTDETTNRAISVVRLALAVPVADRRIARDLHRRKAPPSSPPRCLPPCCWCEQGASAPAGARRRVDYSASAAGAPLDAPPRGARLGVRVRITGSAEGDLPPPPRRREICGGYADHVAQFGGGSSRSTGPRWAGTSPASCCFTANDPEYQPGFEGVDTSVAVCVSFYGAYDHLPLRRGRSRRTGGLVERMVRTRPGRSARCCSIGCMPEPRRPRHRRLPRPDRGGARIRGPATRKCSRPTASSKSPGAQHAFEIFATARISAEAVVRGVHRFLVSADRSCAGLGAQPAPLGATDPARGLRPWSERAERRTIAQDQRLSRTDAGFLAAETPEWHMHVGGARSFDADAAPYARSGAGPAPRHGTRLPRVPTSWRCRDGSTGRRGRTCLRSMSTRTFTRPGPSGRVTNDGLAASVGDALRRPLSIRGSRPLWELWRIDGLHRTARTRPAAQDPPRVHRRPPRAEFASLVSTSTPTGRSSVPSSRLGARAPERWARLVRRDDRDLGGDDTGTCRTRRCRHGAGGTAAHWRFVLSRARAASRPPFEPRARLNGAL